MSDDVPHPPATHSWPRGYGKDESSAALVTRLDAHLGRHPRRDRDCPVCTVILATVMSWGEDDSDWPDVVTPLDGDGPDTPLDGTGPDTPLD